MNAVQSFLRKLPEHECELSLMHNQHKSCHQTVEQFWNERLNQGSVSVEDWVSVEQRDKAFATNEMWELQWYPNTPIGFNRLFACDLEALLDEVNK